MNYQDEIEDIVDSIRHKVTNVVGQFIDDTPRDLVVQAVKQWIDDGHLVLRSQQGTRAEVANKVKDGALFPTTYAGIMATSESVRDAFEHYVSTNRIMDSNKVAVRKGLYTEYSINKACMNGELVRVANFANALALYVD